MEGNTSTEAINEIKVKFWPTYKVSIDQSSYLVVHGIYTSNHRLIGFYGLLLRQSTSSLSPPNTE